jgi:quinol monooxygenase YgiN
VAVVQLLVRLTTEPGQTGQLVEALHSVMRGAQRQGVCSDTHVALDADDGRVVWYFEDWADIEAFERHLRSDRFARLLSVLELSAEPPRLECRLISESRGLDYLAAVRGVPAWTVDRRQG